MEASHDAKTSRPAVWRSSTAKGLHNQVGYAFRRARTSGCHAACWGNGLALAKHLVCWTHTLDEQLSSSTQDAPMHSSDLDLKGSRQLSAHHTNETIAPLDDDVASVVSCATTETCGIRSVSVLGAALTDARRGAPDFLNKMRWFA